MKFQLGDWSVDEETNILKGADSEIRLEKRVMAVLIELAAAEGSVVSKDALIDSVWNGSIISDHSVANAISDLRRALGDDTRNPRYIETIPKRGYRLLAQPQLSRDENNTSQRVEVGGQSRPKWRWAAAAAILILTLIAVASWRFPNADLAPKLFLTDFENTTGDERWDITAATSTEMLTAALAGGEYRLVRWRDSNLEEAKVSARDRILRGTLIIDGDTPLFAVELVDGADQSTLWADTYSATATRLAAMANSIVVDLRVPLMLTDVDAIAFGAADPAIFEAYWRARYLWSLREHGAIRDALRILLDVTNEAPDFAPAHAALADIYAHKTAEELGLARQDTFARAEKHLKEAQALAPNSSDVFVSLAYLAFYRDRDFEGAVEHIENAIAMDPTNAVAWQTKAMIASAAGNTQLSLDAVSRARALDPLSASLLWDEVWFFYVGGRFDEALEASMRARRTTAPVAIYEALIYLARGDEDAALGAWLLRAKDRGLDNVVHENILKIAQSQGPRAGLAALAESEYAEHPVPRAALYASLGRHEEAAATLLTYEQAEKSWWVSWYPVIPAFDLIRNDARLDAFTQSTKNPSGQPS